ncbi:MAG: Uma2 family endonuclease [Coleofasciculaceae cyanobacterium SM2_1_6]|nr:Uma2 family endonuclease [Coleofasciculaceae cyanobacterium SM2_1_6]
MTVTTQKLTFEEYLEYSNGTDTRYELVKGELVPMSLGTGKHGRIIKLLERIFDAEIARSQTQWVSLALVVGVRSPRGGKLSTSRIPDVVVIPELQWQSLQNREAVIDLGEPPPLLVVEVVSPRTRNTDCRLKVAEYDVLNVLEYWIVDPQEEKVTIFTLAPLPDEGFQEPEIFTGEMKLRSTTFPNLELTVTQLFN